MSRRATTGRRSTWRSSRQLVPADQRQSLGGLDQAAKQAGLTALPFDVWIDADQRVGSSRSTSTPSSRASDESVKASLDVELYDYGKPLELELPPADQVADAATLKPTS